MWRDSAAGGSRRPRAPISGVVALVMGCAVGSFASILAGWVAMRFTDLPRAFDWAMWAGRNYPWLNFSDLPLVEFGNWTIQRGIVINVIVVTLLIALLAIAFLYFAFTSFLPADRSADGNCRIEYTSGTPRAGCMLEGRVWLARRVHPGDSFTVRLKCTFLRLISFRQPGAVRQEGFAQERFGQEERIAHQRDRDVNAVDDGSGCFVPFSFEIPPTAHVDSKHSWRVEVFPAKGVSGKTWTFDFKMAPAAAGRLHANA